MDGVAVEVSIILARTESSILFWDKEEQSSFVTIENPPIPFSPFSLTNCTMLSHFSFNDFVAIAFPDLAGDLDVQI